METPCQDGSGEMISSDTSVSKDSFKPQEYIYTDTEENETESIRKYLTWSREARNTVGVIEARRADFAVHATSPEVGKLIIQEGVLRSPKNIAHETNHPLHTMGGGRIRTVGPALEKLFMLESATDDKLNSSVFRHKPEIAEWIGTNYMDVPEEVKQAVIGSKSYNELLISIKDAARKYRYQNDLWNSYSRMWLYLFQYMPLEMRRKIADVFEGHVSTGLGHAINAYRHDKASEQPQAAILLGLDSIPLDSLFSIKGVRTGVPISKNRLIEEENKIREGPSYLGRNEFSQKHPTFELDIDLKSKIGTKIDLGKSALVLMPLSLKNQQVSIANNVQVYWYDDSIFSSADEVIGWLTATKAGRGHLPEVVQP